MTESHKKTIYRTISWRVVGIVLTYVIAYIVTGSIKVATSLAVIDSIIKTIAYWVHERLWLKVKV